MANVGNLEAHFKLDSSQFMAGVKSAQDSLSSLSNSVKAVGTAIAGYFAFSSLSDMRSAAIKAASESEDATVRLNTALAISNQYSAEYSKHLSNMASELQGVTKYSDEAIMGVQSQLIAFGAESENLERLTKSVLDLSAGLGKDLPESSMLMGKALAGEFGMFSRVGIHITETGTQAEKLEQALRQVEQRFGGLAVAAGSTYSGKLEQSKNAFDDFLEAIGNIIVTSPVMIDLLEHKKEKFEALTKWVVENSAGLQAWSDAAALAMKAAKQLAMDGLAPLIENGGQVVPIFKDLTLITEDLGKGFGALAKIANLAFTQIAMLASDLSGAFAKYFGEQFGIKNMFHNMFDAAREGFASMALVGAENVELLGGVGKAAEKTEREVKKLSMTMERTFQNITPTQPIEIFKSKDADQWKKTIEDGITLQQKYRTEAEKSADELEKANYLLSVGVISQETMNRFQYDAALHLNNQADALAIIQARYDESKSIIEATTPAIEKMADEKKKISELYALDLFSAQQMLNIEKDLAERTRKARLEQLRTSKSFFDNVQYGLLSLRDDTNSAGDFMQRTFKNVFESMEDGIAKFVTTGQFQLADLKNSLISIEQEIIKMTIRKTISEPASEGLASTIMKYAPIALSLFSMGSGVESATPPPNSGSMQYGTYIPPNPTAPPEFTSGNWKPPLPAPDVRPLNINMTVNTPDANGFIRNQGDIVASMNRAMASGRRNL